MAASAFWMQPVELKRRRRSRQYYFRKIADFTTPLQDLFCFYFAVSDNSRLRGFSAFTPPFVILSRAKRRKELSAVEGSRHCFSLASCNREFYPNRAFLPSPLPCHPEPCETMQGVK